MLMAFLMVVLFVLVLASDLVLRFSLACFLTCCYNNTMHQNTKRIEQVKSVRDEQHLCRARLKRLISYLLRTKQLQTQTKAQTNKQ